MGSNLKAPFFLAKFLSRSLLNNKGCIGNIVDIHAESGLMGIRFTVLQKLDWQQ